MPKLPAKFSEIDAWRATLKPRTDTVNDDPTMIEIRRRKLTAEAIAKEATARIEAHKARLLESDICSLSQVDEFLSQLFQELRTMLVRLPEDAAAAYPVKIRCELETDLRDRVELILRALHGKAQILATIKD